MPPARRLIAAALAAPAVLPAAAPTQADGWQATLDEAAGQTVYFNAWGGDPAINRYLEWTRDRVRDDYGIDLRHVRVADVAESVARILAERAAGKNQGGSVDLLWINGENFAALKNAGLLHGPWTATLPNAALIDWEGNPTTQVDGSLATAGYELPWGTAALTLFFDTARVPDAPATPADLLAWIERHPGRFSYPRPPAFLGSGFLKQLLLALTDDPARLAAPAGDDFDAVSAPLWQWLDRAHPSLWRSGRLFPRSGPAQRDLLAVGELDWTLSFNPSEARRAVAQGELHAGIGAGYLAAGALANSHFLAIPYNARAAAGARVVANFLTSPEAQARKADARYWGDPTVLDLTALAPADRARFAASENGEAAAPRAARFLSEPHPSWTTRLEQAWLRRYVRR
ncbi:MAG: ABC transporter substrate-binding protein [Pseudomonadota bacterium]